MLACICLLAACSQKKESKNAFDELNETVKKANSSNKTTSYDTKQGELLTIEMVTAALGVDAAAITATVEVQSKYGGYSNYADYSWKGNRKHKITQGVEVPMPNQVRLDGIKATTRAAFDMDYKNLTAEEQAKVQEQFLKTFDEQAKKRNLSEEQKKVGRSVAAEMGVGNTKYEQVAGVGEKAMWDENKEILYVLYKNVKFNISVKADKGKAYDKEKAMELGNGIIANMK